MKFFKGEGCDQCDGTGYRGRQGLYEVMVVSPKIRRMIMHSEGADAMKQQAMPDHTRLLIVGGEPDSPDPMLS